MARMHALVSAIIAIGALITGRALGAELLEREIQFPGDRKWGIVALREPNGGYHPLEDGSKWSFPARGKVCIPAGMNALFEISLEPGVDLAPLATIDLSRFEDVEVVSHHASQPGLITDKEISSLKNLGAINMVNLSGVGITDEGLAVIACFPGLQTLMLHDTAITDKGIASLAKAGKLQFLVLSETRITDRGLSSIGSLPQLRNLQISGAKVTDAGLVQISQLKNLAYLSVREAGIKGSGLSSLRDLPKLKSLILKGNPVVDEHLVELNGLGSLDLLDLSNTKVTLNGLARLNCLPALNFLNVEGTSVDFGGNDPTEELRAIEAFKQRTGLPRTLMIKTSDPGKKGD